MISCGICHTDEAYRTREWGTPLKLPIVLGHEGAGVVIERGPGVTRFAVGDKVCMTTPYCGECHACSSGKTWYCERAVELEIGGFDYNGKTPLSFNGKPVHLLFNQSAFQQYTVLNINNCVKMPADFDMRLAGPLGCGLRTGAGTIYSCLKPKVGEWVSIFGTGTVGLAAMWMAKAMGARVVMVDMNQKRLDDVLAYGADAVVNTTGLNDFRLIGDRIIAKTGGKGADYTMEGTGAAICHKAAMYSLKFGGRCAQVANINAIAFNSYSKDCNDGKEITFVKMGNCDGNEIIPVMADMYKRGRFPYDKVLTFYPFEAVNQALADLAAHRVFKPVLLFD